MAVDMLVFVNILHAFLHQILEVKRGKRPRTEHSHNDYYSSQIAKIEESASATQEKHGKSRGGVR